MSELEEGREEREGEREVSKKERKREERERQDFCSKLRSLPNYLFVSTSDLGSNWRNSADS